MSFYAHTNARVSRGYLSRDVWDVRAKGQIARGTHYDKAELSRGQATTFVSPAGVCVYVFTSGPQRGPPSLSLLASFSLS